MSRIIVEGPRSFHVAQPAEGLIEDREMAADAGWATAHMDTRPDFAWVLGRFVEADQPNENGHIFGLEDLQRVHDSVVSTPLNMLHRAHHVVGAFTATRIVEPTAAPVVPRVSTTIAVPPSAQASWTTNQTLTDTPTLPLTDRSDGRVANPHVEALAAFWRWVFPEEYAAVRGAFDAGAAYFSMEAVPSSLSCPACGGTFAYAGARSEVYCAHLNAHRSPKVLNDPHFVGGAMIIPPTRPGWRKADITELAALIEANEDRANELYDQVAAASPQLDPAEWEGLMSVLLAAESDDDLPLRTRVFAASARLADLHGAAALHDGSHVIETRVDLVRALDSFATGGAKGRRAELKRHLVARARYLGLTDELPSWWLDGIVHAADDETDVPRREVLEAYVAHLAKNGWEIDEPPDPTATKRALGDGGPTLWQMADGFGEWYFVDNATTVEWVATKMADVGAYLTAENLGISRSDVADAGWGDEAWLEMLARRLNG